MGRNVFGIHATNAVMRKYSSIFWSTILFRLTVAIIIVATICGALYLREANQIESNMLDREARRMEIFTWLFSRDVNSAVTDLRLLSTGDALQAYLATGRP